ncbi:MAG: restriction endonuclease subunit S [Bacillota bacterium]|nr:restriction endonuclease subunit S [Bacillota bacterium]
MEYTSCKLNEVLREIHSGGTPSTSVEEYWNGSYKWLSSGETNQRFIYDTESKITERGIKESSTKLAKKHSVVMACAGQGKTRGQVSFLFDEMYVNQSVIVLNPYGDIVLPLYLFYNLTNRYDELRGGSDASSTRGSITTSSLKNLSFSYPSLRTQERIIDILFSYDSLIEVNNKRIKLLEQMAEELYKEWFVRFRFPGYENTEFKDGLPKGWTLSTEYKPIIPKGWHYGEFGELGKFARGKNITSAEMIEGEIPVISAGLEPSGFHNEANVHGRSLTISASGANAGYMKYNLDDIWAADCSYYQDSEKLWFAYHSLRFLQPVISNLQCGAAQPHVHPKQINKLMVIIPPENIISKFCGFAEPIYAEIKQLRDTNNNLIKQRDLLLPRLMSGKLEV